MAQARVRARNLLSTYYGDVGQNDGPVSAAANDEDDLNIDSSAFAVDKVCCVGCASPCHWPVVTLTEATPMSVCGRCL